MNNKVMYLYGSDSMKPDFPSVYNLYNLIMLSFDMVTILSVKYNYLETYLILTILFQFGIKGNISLFHILSLNAIILQLFCNFILHSHYH